MVLSWQEGMTEARLSAASYSWIMESVQSVQSTVSVMNTHVHTELCAYVAHVDLWETPAAIFLLVLRECSKFLTDVYALRVLYIPHFCT